MTAKQGSLFGPARAAREAPAVPWRETSVEAAEAIAPVLAHLEARVLEVIRSCGAHGATCDEVELHTGLRHQTASARINGLMQRGAIVATGDKRRTRSGRRALVWRVA